MPGPSNTLLIEGSFGELAEELAQYLDPLLKSEPGAGLEAEIEPALKEIREKEQAEEPSDSDALQKKKDDVLKKIVGKASVLNSAPEKGMCFPVILWRSILTSTAEFTAAYNLLIYLSNQSPTRDMLLARICQYLSEQPVTSSTLFGSSLALTTLTTIFNTLPSDSDSRYHVFMAILKVIRATSATQAFETLTTQLRTNVPKWLAAWQLDDEDARQLHIAIADVAAASGNNDMAFEYLLLALDTIPPDQASSEEAQVLAKRTLTAAFTNPSITDFTPLTASDAIQALRRSEAGLIELLEIFSSDDYSSYLDFIKSTSLSSLGLPDSASSVLETKIRLLTLATIAANAQNRSVPYSEIAKALQIPASDIEIWVIDTIRAGLVEGKLSQMKQEFLVQRATYRVFGEKQWAEIQGRLMVWRRSLESVLGVIKSEREKFAREGPGGHEEQPQQARTNGYGGGGDRRQGGGRMNRQPREVDFASPVE
jgi:translation initiation factor 3 subunit M